MEPQTVEYVDVEQSSQAIIPVDDRPEDIFKGISEIQLTDEQIAIINAPVDEMLIEIRGDGQVYYPEMEYRRMLNKAFKPGRWGMRPMGQPVIREGLVLHTWTLYIGGQFVAWATGEMELIKENEQMTYGDILEGSKSVALRRLCKDLGIASELWNKRWVDGFLKRWAFKVWVAGKNKPQWRRIDSEPFFKETGIADDSPNKDKYKAAAQAVKRESVTRPQAQADSHAGVQTKVTASSTPVQKEQQTTITIKVRNNQTGEIVESEKPAHEHIDSKFASWFIGTFVGKGNVFETTYHLLGVKNPKDGKEQNYGHIGVHFGVKSHSLVDLTYEQAGALVAYAYAKAGDEIGRIDPKYYADKLEQAELDKGLSEAVPITADAARTDAVAIVERWSEVVGNDVSLSDICLRVFALAGVSYLSDEQREQISLVVDLVEQGKAAKDIEAIVKEMMA